MLFYLALQAWSGLVGVEGFVVNPPSACFLKVPRSNFYSHGHPNKNVFLGLKAKSDEEDDWYSDYDEEKFSNAGGGGGGGSSYAPAQSYSKPRSSGSSRDSSGSSSRSHSKFDSSGDQDHDYSRDTSDTSAVDLDTVNELISERLQAKFSRDFNVADSIRERLLSDFGVGIFDKERTWRTGCTAGDTGMPGSQGRGDRRHSRVRDFGPSGHDYMPTGGVPTSSLRIEEIDDMIAKRLQAKLNRNFDVADEILDSLYQNGVHIHDGQKEWRADGMTFGDGQGDGRPGRNIMNRTDKWKYTQSEHSLDTTDDKVIMDLVAQRTTAKMERNYDQADDIREELVQDFNVYINDKVKKWSVGGDFGPDVITNDNKDTPYNKSLKSDRLSSDDESYIQGEVDERLQAKITRDYQEADNIRDDLFDQYSVQINDKEREWYVMDKKKNNKSDTHDAPYNRRGGGDLSEEQLAMIQSIILERDQAKQDGNNDLVNQLKNELKENFKIGIDDINREWHVNTDDYIQVRAQNTPSHVNKQTLQLISQKINERTSARNDEDYNLADQIRDELVESYQVVLLDRVKEWHFAGNDNEGNNSEYENTDPSTVSTDNDIDIDLEDALSDLLGDIDNSPAEKKESLQKLTVPQLKDRLKQAGLKVGGKKADLIERITTNGL